MAGVAESLAIETQSDTPTFYHTRPTQIEKERKGGDRVVIE